MNVFDWLGVFPRRLFDAGSVREGGREGGAGGVSKLKYEMWALVCVVGEMKLHSKSSERDRAEGEHEDVKLYASGVRECA